MMKRLMCEMKRSIYEMKESPEKPLRAYPRTHPLLHSRPAWSFSNMPLWSQTPGLFRGSMDAGTHTTWACLNIRTTDRAIDRRAIKNIVQRLGLSPRPSERGETAFYFDRLPGRITLEKCAGGNHYSIKMVSPSDTTAVKRLAVILARELYEMKEKPHFSDSASRRFAAALFLW